MVREDKTPRGRGRPPAASAASIARQALVLFAGRGYAATSMGDIAEAAGVSRRTLYRYFDSKAAIIWEGMEESLRAAVAGLAAAPPDRPWRSAVADTMIASLTFPHGDAELARQRLRLIAEEPVLRSHLLAATRPAIEALACFIAERTGARPSDLEPTAASASVWTATMTAVEWWAASDGGIPAEECARRVLGSLGFTASARGRTPRR
jgi:AcrR family transcriptional regulator